MVCSHAATLASAWTRAATRATSTSRSGRTSPASFGHNSVTATPTITARSWRWSKSSAATAAANGTTYTHFAQSGNGFFEPMAQFGYESYRGANDPNTRAVSPFQVPAALGNPRFTINQTTQDNSNNAWTTGQAQAVMDAIADSGPFVVNLMCHKILPDGSSGYSFPNPDSYYNLTETVFMAMLSRANTYISAGLIRNAKPSELPALRRAAARDRR